MKLAVLGHNIAYTLSPRLHAALIAALGEEGTYAVEDIPHEDLDKELPRLLNEYDGFNVTKPYKEKVAAALGCGGAVNTVRRDGGAVSTDGYGFLRDYSRHFGDPAYDVLVLGAGGAARSVCEALGEYGCRIFLYNRTYQKAEAFEKSFARDARLCGRDKYLFAVKDAADIPPVTAVINCTSAGLNGEQALPAACPRKFTYAYDLVYSPAVTPFMERTAADGAKVANGLGMLVYQAIAAQAFWRGMRFTEAEEDRLFECAMQALKAQKQ